MYVEKNARADEIIAERERLKNQRINSRIQGMKKRAEVTEMFEKVRFVVVVSFEIFCFLRVLAF